MAGHLILPPRHHAVTVDDYCTCQTVVTLEGTSGIGRESFEEPFMPVDAPHKVLTLARMG